jgi:hypothetical protein
MFKKAMDETPSVTERYCTAHIHSSFSNIILSVSISSLVTRLTVTHSLVHSFIRTSQHIMPVRSTTLRAALLTSGLAVQTAYAYTQVNVPSPFIYKNIDPIVFPGEHSKSHLHSIFGSDAVTVDTTKSDELRAGCTNAENPNDLSVYWVPTLLYKSDTGALQPVPVGRFGAYYGLGDSPAEVPIPENLAMLAGEAHAEWHCEGDAASPLDTNGFPSKGCSTILQQLLYFPNCKRPSMHPASELQAPQQSIFIKLKMIDVNPNCCINIKHSLHVILQSTEYPRCFESLISPSSLSL